MTEEKRLLTVLDQIRSRDRVRKRVIDAASRLYARQGFRATSMEQIAEEAGVTLPVVYSYVKNKSTIMEFIMQDLLQAFEEAIETKRDETYDPGERLRTAFELFCRLVSEQQDKVLLLYWNSHTLDRQARGRVMEHEVSVSRIFADIIEEGTAKGFFQETDADLAAYNLMMQAYMWILKGWHFHRRITLDAFIQEQLAFALKALKA